MDETVNGKTDGGESFANFADAISKFTVGFNKGVVLSTVTSNSLDIIGRNLEFMKTSLETVVTAFEEIRATSESTTKNSSQISGMMDQVEKKNSSMNNGIAAQVEEVGKAASDAREINGLFKNIAKKSVSVRDISAEIQDVSDRTNILAINASIEAARAGELGKGFRIIANEVRSLAGKTGNFAKEIETTISGFTGLIDVIAEKMETFLNLLDSFQNQFQSIGAAFSENNGAITQAGQNLSLITAAIIEQNSALADGLNSLEKIFQTSQDSESVIAALIKSHAALDSLLNRKS